MAEMRTKVDALKDLGEKVTGATLIASENETIVGMIDKIADNYEGGGSGGNNIVEFMNTEIGDLSTNDYIEDEADEQLLTNIAEGNINPIVLACGENSSTKSYNFIAFKTNTTISLMNLDGGCAFEKIANRWRFTSFS